MTKQAKSSRIRMTRRYKRRTKQQPGHSAETFTDKATGEKIQRLIPNRAMRRKLKAING